MTKRNRKNDEIRKVRISRNLMGNAYSNILIECGKTKILCTASLNNKIPVFIDENEMGWLTAEYNMLPGSTLIRKSRPLLKPDSRSIEIQRIIGRSLRAAIDLTKIKGYSIVVDCDVIQADGGTRTTSITGGYIVLRYALNMMLKDKLIKENPLKSQIASISAGIVNGEVLLDLDYEEDSKAEVDINVVMNKEGNIIEIQGTGEKGDISRQNLNKLLDYCESGINKLFNKQDEFFQDLKI